MREKASYRDNMAWLNEVAPDAGLLTAMDVARIMGVDPKTARKMLDGHYVTGTKYISKPSLARLLAT